MMGVQYWRSFEQLEAFARSSDHAHLPAWREFNRLVRDNGDVGIFHETYRVGPGTAESFYGNMPPFGLAAAVGFVPVARRGQSAGRRMGTASDGPASGRPLLIRDGDVDDVGAERCPPDRRAPGGD